jgi:hypothetical protein
LYYFTNEFYCFIVFGFTYSKTLGILKKNFDIYDLQGVDFGIESSVQAYGSSVEKTIGKDFPHKNGLVKFFLNLYFRITK